MAKDREDRDAVRESDAEWLDPADPGEVQGIRRQHAILWNKHLQDHWTIARKRRFRASIQQFLTILGAAISVVIGAYTLYNNFFPS